MKDSIDWLDKIRPSERLFVGEKAFNLSRLQQQGFPVVPGFVIRANAFHQFLEQLHDSESLLVDFPASSLYLNVDNPQALQLVAQQSRQVILNTNLPQEWLEHLLNTANQLNSSIFILRASVTTPVQPKSVSTGLFPSRLCKNNPQELELAIKSFWSQLFSSKSLFYWQRMGIGLEKVNLAILVQPITNAIVSGVAYIQPDGFYVQASWGLGYSLLKGDVIPDLYQINSLTGQVETKQLGNKTRAYRLNYQSETSSAAILKEDSYLEAYLLSQEEQTNYCLNDYYLEKVRKNLQKLAKKVNSLEWIIGSREQVTEPSLSNTLEPNFYIVQCNFNRSQWRKSTDKIILNNIPNPESNMTDSQPILIGLPVSPGIIYGNAYVVTDLESSLKTIPEGQILVTKSIIPDWLPWLKKTVGIITEDGGLTSHAAIIARELGIPAIVGAKGATKLLTTGEFIQLNGDQGEIFLEKNSITKPPEKINEEIKIISHKFNFNYPIATQLMVNLSQTSSIANAVTLPIDGVGLLRSELMLLELLAYQAFQDWLDPSQQSKFIQQWSKLITQFAREFAPRPVFYRSLDWIVLNSEESIQKEKRTVNSLLGKRGTYSYRLDTIVFNLELQALKQVYQSGNTNVNLILPFVRSLEEFQFCRNRLEKIGIIQQQSFQLWIMAEVPSVIFLLPQYIEAGVQGIAIGTNDLTQLLLGVDREEAKLSQEYNATHPAMIMALKQLITQAKAGGISCSICGQAPVQYPELIDHLIRWGITSISVEPEAVEKTYHLIARAEQRLILEKSRMES